MPSTDADTRKEGWGNTEQADERGVSTQSKSTFPVLQVSYAHCAVHRARTSDFTVVVQGHTVYY